MCSAIIQDVQVQKHFLNVSHKALCRYIDQLQIALHRYSSRPEIIPPRLVDTTMNGNTTHLIMPVLDDVFSGLKWLGYNPQGGLGFVGAVTVTDPRSGGLIGVVQAKQLTGVRTALASCIGIRNQLSAFKNKTSITVFGTGLQSFWHIFVCAKLLEGREIAVNVIYRSSPMDTALVEDHLPSLKVAQIQLSDTEQVRDKVSQSNIIFGCVPSTEPSILKEYLEASSGPEYTYISLIGSYKSHMHECDTALVEQFKDQGVQILVDSKEHTLIEAGELIDANVAPTQLLEIGNLEPNKPLPKSTCKNGKLVTLCKIVGLAIMDVSMAKTLLADLSS